MTTPELEIHTTLNYLDHLLQSFTSATNIRDALNTLDKNLDRTGNASFTEYGLGPLKATLALLSLVAELNEGDYEHLQDENGETRQLTVDEMNRYLSDHSDTWELERNFLNSLD